MIRIAQRLWLGGQSDWERTVRLAREPWRVIHACKEPYHRLFVGYSGRGCPRDSPEYLWAVRGRRIALNLVDGQEPEWVPEEAVDFALDTIGKWSEEFPVLLHCNRGERVALGCNRDAVSRLAGTVPRHGLRGGRGGVQTDVSSLQSREGHEVLRYAEVGEVQEVNYYYVVH